MKGVTNSIRLQAVPVPSDIKQRIKDTFKRQAELDAVQIVVETSGSRITLRGTVRSLAERRDAERAVWNTPGTTRVENHLVVSTPLAVSA